MASGTESSRLISLIEVCAAILIVAAHNVFHLIPNEVPILFVLAIASFRIREGNWGLSLYSRPDSWPGTLVVAGACLALLVLKDLIFDPPGKVSSVITSARDVPRLLTSLAIAWGFAAFLEEIGYRGYLLRRAVEAFGPSRIGSALALLTASAAFGLGHYYKGPAGMPRQRRFRPDPRRSLPLYPPTLGRHARARSRRHHRREHGFLRL